MELKELLKNSCDEMNVALNEKQLDQFIKYKKILLEWNAKFNLTSITDEKEIILKHFIDCLSIASGTEIDKNASIIDVGTGAGFPGVPLKIAFPEMKVTLLDSLNKRISFLNCLVEELGLSDVSCIHMRAEDGGVNKDLRENFDMCISRAVANLAVLSEYCIPFVKVGGFFISLKGSTIEDELKEAQKAIKVLGGRIEEVKTIHLPNTEIIHTLVIIKKIRQTPSLYPRKAGKASKEPIK